MNRLICEKVDQALEAMKVCNIECWVIFTQEMGKECDPVYPLLMGNLDLAAGALVLFQNGEKIAIVSGLDQMLPVSTGVWTHIESYSREKNALTVLAEILAKYDPKSIAINYSQEYNMADGITHGKYLSFMDSLSNTVYAARICSAQSLVSQLKEIKTPEEIKRIKKAIDATDIVFERLRSFLKPNLTGKEIFDFVQKQVINLGAGFGWSAYNCPILTIGPVAYMGHTPPDEKAILRRGNLLQVDLGLNCDGYCSDFQRMFYICKEDETTAPSEVTNLFEHVHNGISQMIDAIKPGVPNVEISKIGFSELTSNGFSEPQYSAGHQLGRAVHDGGTGLLNYHMRDSNATIKQGNVFTVEGLETRLPEYGFVSLEEDIVVTQQGAELLTKRQNHIYCIK